MNLISQLLHGIKSISAYKYGVQQREYFSAKWIRERFYKHIWMQRGISWSMHQLSLSTAIHSFPKNDCCYLRMTAVIFFRKLENTGTQVWSDKLMYTVRIKTGGWITKLELIKNWCFRHNVNVALSLINGAVVIIVILHNNRSYYNHTS